MDNLTASQNIGEGNICNIDRERKTGKKIMENLEAKIEYHDFGF